MKIALTHPWIQLVVLSLSAPLFLFPSSRFVWILLLIPILVIFRKFMVGGFLPRTLLNWSLLLLSFQVFMTCFVVDNITDALPKISGLLFSVALFFALVDLLKTERLLKLGVLAFALGGFGFSILSLLGMFRYNEKNFDVLFDLSILIPRINFNLPGASAGFNPNAVGGILILFVPVFLVFLVYLFRRDREKYQLYKSPVFRYFILLGSILAIFVLLITQSRGSWIGLVAGFSILLFLGRGKKKYAFMILFVCALVFTTIVGFNRLPQQTEGAKQRITSRMMLWSFAVETISEHPINGFGMNRIRQHHEVGYELAHVHNHFLHTAAEMGLPALIAYLAILMGMGVMCFRVLKRSSRGWIRITVLGLAAGQIAHLLFGLGDSIPLGAKIGIFFWISAALITALFIFTQKESSLNEVEPDVETERPDKVVT